VNRNSKEDKSIRMHVLNTSWFDKKGNLDWRQLVGKTLLLIAFFLIVYAIGLYFVRGQYHIIGDWVSNRLGFMGIAIFVFVTDMLIMPMSVDLLFPFVLDWDPVPLLLTMSISSALAGCGGYWIGRLLGKLPFIRQLTSSFSADGEKLINKFGIWAVVIAGITPIPYSTVCWMAGMVKMNFAYMAIASLSRFPRMLIYYLIFKGGLSFIFV